MLAGRLLLACCLAAAGAGAAQAEPRVAEVERQPADGGRPGDYRERERSDRPQRPQPRLSEEQRKALKQDMLDASKDLRR